MNIKLYLISCILSFCICSCNTRVERVFESGAWDFDQCINLENLMLYKDYLIITEEQGQGTKFTVIDYYKNEIDSVFRNKLSKNGISHLQLQNDSLFGYSDSKKDWFYWNGRKWIKKELYSNPYLEKFLETELSKRCYYICKDEDYYMFMYNHGEFGSGIIFLNKENGKLTGYPMFRIASILKDSSKYIISSNFERSESREPMVVKINNPEDLPVIPDSLLSKKDWYGLDHYIIDQIFLTLDDSIKSKLELIDQKIAKIWEKEGNGSIVAYDNVMHYELQKDSLLAFNSNVEYLLNGLHWYRYKYNMLCRSSFFRDHQLLHIVEKDGCMFVAQLDRNGIKSIQDTLMCQLALSVEAFDVQFSDKRLMFVDYDWSNRECKRLTIFIIYNGLLKRYNFGF